MFKSSVMTFIFLCLSVGVESTWAMEIFEGGGESFAVTEPSKIGEIYSLTEKHLKERKKGSVGSEDKYRVVLKVPVNRAAEDREKEVDLTYVFKDDIVGKDGVLIRKKGDSYNPLDALTMPSLLIVDGEDEEQVKWAIGKKEDFSGEYMILLTNGSFKTILREYQLRVFRLTDSLQKRFEITHVPCSVIQEGNKIIVSEYEL